MGRKSWLHEFAERFLEATTLGAAGIKTFVNLILVESWESEAEAPPEYRRLYDTREQLEERDGKIVLPPEVMVLTAGVETQDDRLECTIVGWAENDDSWVIDHSVFYGDPSTVALWDQLDEHLQKRWLHPSGQRSYPEICLNRRARPPR
jgi:phage terminase large subunit GpA-like protein